MLWRAASSSCRRVRVAVRRRAHTSPRRLRRQPPGTVTKLRKIRLPNHPTLAKKDATQDALGFRGPVVYAAQQQWRDRIIEGSRCNGLLYYGPLANGSAECTFHSRSWQAFSRGFGRLKALSVRAPWWWAILHGKPVENRNWATRVRDRVALHASKFWKMDEIARDWWKLWIAL